MLKDKFIAFVKAVLLLSILIAIILFNSNLSKQPQPVKQKVINETAVHEEVERLQRNKIIAETAQKYKQTVLKQEKEQYQQLNKQGQKYINNLTAEQTKEQKQLNKLKQQRLQAKQELKKIRQEREKLSNANSSTN